MAGPFNPTSEPRPHATDPSTVVLVAGRTFCIASGSGDIGAGSADGLFAGDFRLLRRVELDVDGAHVDVLAVERPVAGRCRFVGRTAPWREHPALVVLRSRELGARFVERIELRNHGAEAREVEVRVVVEADRAFIFDVKDGRVDTPPSRPEVGDGVATFVSTMRDGEHRVQVHGSGATVVPRDEGVSFTWCAVLAPGGSWHGALEVPLGPTVADAPSPGGAAETAPETAPHATPNLGADGTWRGAGLLHCRSWWFPLDTAVARAVRDLDALRLVDPAGRHRPTIAAGAPWFMTLFGRDSLLTSWMALPGDPDLALGVLDALARSQGTSLVAARDEEPGRIMHEVRAGLAPQGGVVEDVYYGSADATALFVMLLDEVDRWGGLPPYDRARLLHAADLALGWIAAYGDRDGDGFVEYLRATPDGLRNQGWKDSWDGVRFADGTVAEPPIALCEVQAYVYGAYLARARLAAREDDAEACVGWYAKAEELAASFDRAFWSDDIGGYVIGLDADKRQIDSIASNMGHALWTGIATPERARTIGRTIFARGLWSGWGVRTLAEGNGGYDPLSYHCGSVWPHDNAIVAAGLARYGMRTEANRIVQAQIAASAHLEGSLPELFAGFAEADVRVPVRYPTSCSPQAWSAASGLLHLRTVLGLDIGADGVPVLDPDVPERFGTVRVSGIRAGGHLYEVHANGRSGSVVRLDSPDARNRPAGPGLTSAPGPAAPRS